MNTLLLVSLGAIFVYVLMEWLFIVTKPSFLSLLPFPGKLGVLFGTSSILAVVLLCLLLIGVILIKILPESAGRYLKLVLVLIPAMVLASTGLLLLDNFTYTLFGFGIVTSKGISRVIYAAAYLLIILVIGYDLIKLILKTGGGVRTFMTSHTWAIYALLAVVVIPSVIVVITNVSKPQTGNLAGSAATGANQPNIILITADGVNSTHMSLYGYERETTPFIDSIADQALIFENNFSNSTNTSGSITSIFTGKYPTTTRVLYPPDILRGKDVYEHLPGILQNQGYYTAQFSFKRYADAYQLNFLNAFDEVNGISSQQKSIFSRLEILPADYDYFLFELENRLSSRIKHIFLIEEMENNYLQAVEEPIGFEDEQKIEKVVELIQSNRAPVFVHIHWMGTHGSYFYPEQRVFSQGKDADSQEQWDDDFYDDSILDFDKGVQTLMASLNGELGSEKNLIIIGSDHGKAAVINERIPLLFLFPSQEYTGWVEGDSQNLSVASTILDYLDIAQPSWMEGESLIKEDYQANYILGMGTTKRVEVEGVGSTLDESYVQPPFYQFDLIHLVNCGKWYLLDLENYSWSEGDVPSYTSNCSREKILTEVEVRDVFIQRLRLDGFEFSDTMLR
ncbi:MAG: sulfatase-like hydrolase/transferase [Anaerolineaceae bacterium]